MEYKCYTYTRKRKPEDTYEVYYFGKSEIQELR